MKSRWLGLLPLLLVAACGAVAETSEPGTAPGAEPPPPASTTPAPTATSEADAAPPVKPTASCGAAAGNRDVLAWVEGKDLFFVRADGTKRSVHQFSVKWDDPSQEVYVEVKSFGGLVVAIANAADSEAVLLDTSGKVLWSKIAKNASMGPALLSANGLVVQPRDGDGKGHAIVVSNTGVAAERAEVNPQSVVMSDGRFAGFLGNNYVWAMPDGTTAPLANDNFDTFQSSQFGVFYVVRGFGQQSTVVIERPGNVINIPIASDGVEIEAVTDSGLAVITTDTHPNTRTYALVDANKGTATPLPASNDFTQFGNTIYRGPSITEAGEVFVPLRNASSAALFALDSLSTWKSIGQHFRDITTMTAFAKGGTYVSIASEIQGFFPTEPWTPDANDPTPVQAGRGVSLERPASAVHRTLDMDADNYVLELSEDGACVAFADKASHLRVLEASVASSQPVDMGALALTKEGQVAGRFAWIR